jgi:hypothetical protein
MISRTALERRNIHSARGSRPAFSCRQRRRWAYCHDFPVQEHLDG